MKKMKRSKFEVSEVMEKNILISGLKTIKPEVVRLIENCHPQGLFVYNPESKIFFCITSEIPNLDLFIFFISCQSTKVAILLYFRAYYNQ